MFPRGLQFDKNNSGSSYSGKWVCHKESKIVGEKRALQDREKQKKSVGMWHVISVGGHGGWARPQVGAKGKWVTGGR